MEPAEPSTDKPKQPEKLHWAVRVAIWVIAFAEAILHVRSRVGSL